LTSTGDQIEISVGVTTGVTRCQLPAESGRGRGIIFAAVRSVVHHDREEGAVNRPPLQRWVRPLPMSQMSRHCRPRTVRTHD
jgi:hypothetical protein